MKPRASATLLSPVRDPHLPLVHDGPSPHCLCFPGSDANNDRRGRRPRPGRLGPGQRGLCDRPGASSRRRDGPGPPAVGCREDGRRGRKGGRGQGAKCVRPHPPAPADSHPHGRPALHGRCRGAGSRPACRPRPGVHGCPSATRTCRGSARNSRQDLDRVFAHQETPRSGAGGGARLLDLGRGQGLRAIGIRIEEPLELSHHSLVQYRLPSTGELVPFCGSSFPRRMPSGCCWPAPSLPTCWARSSAEPGRPPALFPWSARTTVAKVRDRSRPRCCCRSSRQAMRV